MKLSTTFTLAALALTTPMLCQAQDPVGSLAQVRQLAAAGKINEAAQLADRVITKFSGEGYLAKLYSYVVPFYLWEKATMYMKVGRYDEAVEAFKKLNPGQRWSSKEFLNTARANLSEEQMDYVLMYSTASIFQQGHARYKQAIGTDGKGGDLSKLDEAIKYLDEYLKLLEKGKVSKAEKKLEVESQVCFLLMQSCLLKPTPDFKKANEYLEKSMQGKGKLPDDMVIQGLESIVKLATTKPEYIDWAYKIIEGNPSSYNLGAQRSAKFVGKFLNMGEGVEQDYTEAVKWFQKAAEQGNPSAQLRLAARYYRGEGVEQDYKEAAKWFMKSAEQGNAIAQGWLGDCYLTGKGVEKDFTKAVEWFKKAAEQGNPSAQLGLAVRYYRGEGVEQDYTEAVKWFMKSAEQGNATAQGWLGGCFLTGTGVEKDFTKAAGWYRKAAEQGNPSAQLRLALRYYQGEGVKQDYKEAVKWFMKSAEQGNATAQGWLGGCFLTGTGVEKDSSKAAEWFRKAAEQGNADAQLCIGLCYSKGEGVEKDFTKAAEWYRKAAEQGNADAQLYMGLCYSEGEGVEKDFTKAAEWYRKAAEQGNADAQLYMGLCYSKGEGVEKDFTKAAEWCRKAAEQGNADAQLYMGLCYSEGIEKDFTKAAGWYRKAAEQGNPSAQLELAVCYYRGEGVEQDYKEAVSWFKKSAEQGNATAQGWLGRCYLTGEGVERDFSKAVEWYRKAAEQGNPNAQLGLAVRYYRGEGVEQDYKEAAKWFRKAAEQGHEEAAYYVDYIPCNNLEEQGLEEQALKRGALLVQQSDALTTWNLLFSQVCRIYSRLVVNIKTYQVGRELSKDTIRNTLAGFDRLKDASLVLKSKAEARLISSSPEVSQKTIEDIKRLEKLKLSIREFRMNYLSSCVSLPHLRKAHWLLGEAKADRWFGYDSTRVNEAVSHMAIVCCESWVLESNDETREYYYAVLRKLKETVGEADFKDYEQKIKINGGGDAKRGGERWWP